MKKYFVLLLFVPLSCILNAQQSPGNSDGPSGHHKSKKAKRDVSNDKIHYGTASFYANKFEGRETATGEIFSQKKISGASNILPLNHWVRVINTRNNISIVLRINDRMHKNNKRLIDL
ncbi:MAG: septal ring lytic transglycosylase RlpA family protein, partial [Bacteroidota bacterium]|nr:septal ring lytic transglycosylase RlpA family protein [Bacteroidota bacterium]